jgi:hypothetical protein
VLEGLLAYERAVESAPEIAKARRRGEAYLLERGLFRRRSMGDVVKRCADYRDVPITGGRQYC